MPSISSMRDLNGSDPIKPLGEKVIRERPPTAAELAAERKRQEEKRFEQAPTETPLPKPSGYRLHSVVEGHMSIPGPKLEAATLTSDSTYWEYLGWEKGSIAGGGPSQNIPKIGPETDLGKVPTLELEYALREVRVVMHEARKQYDRLSDELRKRRGCLPWADEEKPKQEFPLTPKPYPGWDHHPVSVVEERLDRARKAVESYVDRVASGKEWSNTTLYDELVLAQRRWTETLRLAREYEQKTRPVFHNALNDYRPVAYGLNPLAGLPANCFGDGKAPDMERFYGGARGGGTADPEVGKLINDFLDTKLQTYKKI